MVQIGRYNANDHAPREALDPLPAGWYAMQIVGSEVKPTKDQKSQYLQLEFEVLEAYHPAWKGRKVWERLNLWNEKQQVADIANSTLSTISRAVGVMEWEDTQALHHKPLAVKVKQRAATQEYEATNDVSGYDAIAARFQNGAPVSVGTTVPPSAPRPGAAPAAPARAPAPPPQGQPGQGGPPSWRKPQPAPAAQQESAPGAQG